MIIEFNDNPGLYQMAERLGMSGDGNFGCAGSVIGNDSELIIEEPRSNFS